MNDVDFPVQRVLEGIDAAAAAGLPVKVNAVVKRGVNDGDVVALAEHFRGSGHVLRFIEYMDVGSTNGWRLDDVVTAEEIVRRIVASAGRSSRSRPARPDETARRWRYRRRSRRDRRDRLGHAAVLRRLLAGPALGRGPALHVPVRRHAATTCARRSGSAPPTRSSPSSSAAIWTRRTDRYSELRTSETGVAAEGRDVLHRRLSAARPAEALECHRGARSSQLGRRVLPRGWRDFGLQLGHLVRLLLLVPRGPAASTDRNPAKAVVERACA